MTTDEASEPTQEPSDNDQADTDVDDKSEAGGATEAGAGSDAGPQPTDDGDADAAPTSDSDGGGDRADDGASKEPNQKQRLDDLQEDIDRVRAHAEDEVGGTAIHIPETDTTRKVVDRGEEGEVDDTIAPPG